MSNDGAIRLGVLDVLTALIVLAILLWAAYMQFPVYHQPIVESPPTAARHASR